MKLKLSCLFAFVLIIYIGNAQENNKAHVCYPPTIDRSFRKNITNNATESKAILATGTNAYTQSIHNVIVKWQTGSYGSFRIGTAPGLQDIRWGQGLSAAAKHTGGQSYEELRISALALGTTFNIGDKFYVTMDSGLGSEWVSPALEFQWENLGNAANNVTINIETNYGDGGYGPFAGWQETKMMAFYDLINPIIKDVFGPPSRNHDVNIVNDSYAQGVNIYYNGPNQVSTTYTVNADGDLDQPRLMIHELIHAYRDNVGLSSNSEWHYEPDLNGFEEGMSEAVALIVMDKFIGLYPNFFSGDEFKIHWNSARGMPFEWDYDFQNHEQIRNKDYFSTDIATGSHWLRYGMGATAFRKMYIEDPDVFKKFNTEYYNRLNADHNLIPNRALLVDVFDTVVTEVERTPIKEWINNQKILDCDTDIKKKVFMLTFTNISWQSFTQDNRIFFLETHQNGKEWAWTTSDMVGLSEIDESAASVEKWGWTHQLNNTTGQFKTIQDWDNTQYGANKAMINDNHGSYEGQFLSGPYQGANPYYSFTGVTYDGSGWFTRDFMQNQNYSGAEIGKRALAIGSQQMYTSTASNAVFWPSGIVGTRKITDLNQSGLYRWELDFNDPQGSIVSNSYFRLLGDDFIDVKGVFGGIYSDTKDLIEGKLIIEHENHGEEADVVITNNSFKSLRTWISVPETNVDRQGGRADRKYSEPGKTHAIFISDDCTERKIDFRTIGYGEGLDGTQMLLLKVDDFKDITFTETANLSLCPGDAASFSVANNFPDILDGDSRITYQWLDPSNNIVSSVKDFNIASIVNGDAGTYTLQIDFFGCTINKTVDLNLGCVSTIDFDGTDDYANRSSLLGGLSASSMMGWVKTDEVRGADIMGQDSFRIFTNASGQLRSEVKTGTTSSTNGSAATAITPNVWTHVAAIYDGVADTLTLYINGEQVTQVNTTGNLLDVDANDFEIGRRSNGDDRYFKGDMQEVRVYDVALTVLQLQEQVYQSIENNGGKVRGSIVPKDIANSSLNWSNLSLYLKLDPAAVIGGQTTDASSGGNDLTINNMTTTQVLAAPIPYVANVSGAWTTTGTWINGTAWDITTLPNKDWAIVQITNNSKVTTTASHTHLGLLVDSGAELEIQNDQLLQNTSYLKLDGQIDLVGESQLIQTKNSDLEVASTGYLERDQQGKGSIFDYNYWSSPVSPINTTANNTDYSVSDVLYDGTDPNNPIPMNFVSGNNYNGSPVSGGTAATLADYWIFKFVNQDYLYGNWYLGWVRSTGTLKVGEGYTQKGTGAGASQNYVFVGKPNNGVIQHTISAGKTSVLGNPYPSALDADAFITQNTPILQGGDLNGSAITGTLYFWEHWGGNTHVYAAYQGGYATYNLLGGVVAISDPEVSSTGSGSIMPKRYIPVGQGFYLQGASNGTIEFNNTQRVFKKEGGDSVFMRSSADETALEEEEDDISRIYFLFTTPEGPQRQLLLGIKPDLALGFNYGYDGRTLDQQPTECSFKEGEESLVIQGIPSIYAGLELPLEIKIGTSGVCKFKTESLLELPAGLEVFLLDKELNLTTEISNELVAEFELETGTYTDRFYVVFKQAEILTVEDNIEVTDDLLVFYNGSTKNIEISNPSEFTAKNIVVYAITGQEVVKVNNVFTEVNTIEIPVNVVSGAYLVRFDYNNGTQVTKKLIIK
ncbi:MAG: T9SS type A sorting domain-containing protein [Flavobacteriaceae bacterium]|nr:T9SS type A sorting domain-containing protein [Flavobacteriaceae bacterium]